MVPLAELEQEFNAAVSPDFLRDAVRCLSEACSEARQVTFERGFSFEEAHDLIPFYRWKAADRNLRNLVARYDGMESSAEPNDAGNCHYTLIRAGLVRLTVAHAPSPEALIRPAGYRRTLARLNQVAFAFWTEGLRVPPSEGLYAVLLYGTDRDQAITFATVVFPLADADAYAPGRIDLFRVLPGLREEFRAVEAEGEPAVQLTLLEDEARA